MKVLVFTTLYPNNVWPNANVFVKERMTHFARLDGGGVKVVAPVPYFPPFKLGWRWKFSQVAAQEIRDGLEVYHPRYFITPKVGMALYGVMMFLSVWSLVKKIQKNFDFDLIDAHYVYPDGFAAVLLGLFFKRPVVVSARGSDINLFTKFPVIRKLIRYTLGRADRGIAVCEALKKTMVEVGVPDEKVAVIPNGVDLQKFRPAPKEESRKRLGLPDKRLILSVGGIIPRKGFHLLVKALKILTEELHEPDPYLVIVGEGEYRRELEQLVSSLGLSRQVYFAGNVSHEELYLWYSAADLFCLASDREGWPNVVMEALACGTPVVATNVWGVPEIIRSERVGLLTKRTEREIAEKISAALKKTWSSSEIREYISERTWERVALSVLEVFKSVLGARDDLSPKYGMITKRSPGTDIKKNEAR